MGVELKSMLDFTSLIDSWIDYSDHNDCKKGLDLIMEYANFLNQKPELWMCVPVDEEGNVMEKPSTFGLQPDDLPEEFELYCSKFQEAQEKVIFSNVSTVHKDGNVHFVTFNSGEAIGLGFKNSIYQTIEDLAELNVKIKESYARELGLI